MLVQRGDRAAGHAASALDSCIRRDGTCMRCLLRKPEWTNDDELVTLEQMHQEAADIYEPLTLPERPENSILEPSNRRRNATVRIDFWGAETSLR